MITNMNYILDNVNCLGLLNNNVLETASSSISGGEEKEGSCSIHPLERGSLYHW